MRTTVELDKQAEQAVQAPTHEGRGVSEAVDDPIGGLTAQPTGPRFVQRTERLGMRADVSNVADVLETLEGPEHR